MYTNSFYNPYMNYSSFANMGRYATMGKAGLFSGLKKFSLSGFLAGANKTLNVVNQAIPIYYQVKPMIANAKTMFKVMHAVKSDDTPTKTSNYKSYSNQTKKESIKTTDGSPTFFI